MGNDGPNKKIIFMNNIDNNDNSDDGYSDISNCVNYEIDEDVINKNGNNNSTITTSNNNSYNDIILLVLSTACVIARTRT